jgi:hypothetical protein
MYGQICLQEYHLEGANSLVGEALLMLVAFEPSANGVQLNATPYRSNRIRIIKYKSSNNAVITNVDLP